MPGDVDDAMIIEQAHLYDWPAIASMRERYFAQVDRPVQEHPEATWMVCRHGELVVGCYSFQSAPAEYEQTWILDFYRTTGRYGTLAVTAMHRNILERFACEYDVLFTLDPRNPAQEAAVRKHGAEEVGRMYRFPKGSAAPAK
jgi:hypothetical protein